MSELYEDYEMRIDTKAGNYIVSGDIEFENLVTKKPLFLRPGTINPNEFTELFGWFKYPVRYVGMLEDKSIFYLGQGPSDLFENGAYYYDVTFVLAPDRIGKSYKAGQFRDSFWKGGRWK